MVRYIDAGGDEHYVRLAEAASVPFENGRMARNIPAYRDSAHTPGRYWAATTGELVEFESHLEEKWLTLLDFDVGVSGFSSQPMELEAADENGPWSHVPDIFARRADGSALLLDVKNPLKGVEPFTDTTLREVKKLINERGGDVADQKEIAETVIELQNRMDAPETWLARTRKARLRDSERARASALDRARTELGATPDAAGPRGPAVGEGKATAAPARTGPALRAIRAAIPAGRTPGVGEDAEEFDIDFDSIPTYEVWGVKPAQRPDDEISR